MALVSPASPGHGLARQRWLLRAPWHRPPVWEAAGGGLAMPPCVPSTSLGAGRASQATQCHLHPFVPWCHAGNVPRGDSIVRSRHLSHLLLPASRRAGLGGVSFSHGTCQKSLSRFVLVGTRSPVSGCPSLCPSKDPCRVAAWGVPAPLSLSATH